LPRIGPVELFVRLRRRVKRAIRRGCRLANRQEGAQADLDLHDFFDVDQLPASWLEVCEANLRLLYNYVPKAYPGRVLLFRARRRPLWGPFSHDLGWGKLALGGVEVKNVRGQHVSMAHEPYLSRLASLLREALRTAQAIRA